MKKVTLLTLFMVCTLFFLPFGRFSVAQSNGYVGVQEGSEYEWRININIDGLDNVVQNVEGLLTEIQSRISDYDFFGFGTMTIPEVMENISYTLLSSLLPSGWETLNISELLDETLDHFITNFNSTFLSGEIPDNWQSLNYSTFVDAMINGLNETLPVGWEDQPIPFMLNLALSELNDTLLMGILPSGWYDMTLQEFFETLLIESFPSATESFLTYLMMDQLLSTAYMMLPPGADTYTIGEFLPLMIPSEIWNANLSYMLDGLWYMINSTSPSGWDSLPISNYIDTLADYLNYSLTSIDPSLEGATALEILEWGIDMGLYYMNQSMPTGMFPTDWMTMTIQELLNYELEQAKTLWTTMVLPEWESLMSTVETMGGFPSTIGVKIAIDQINPEIESTLGGQRATPIDMTLFISVDMETWTSLDDLFSGSGSLSLSDSNSTTTIIMQTLLNFTTNGYIVDPSTYSDQKIALLDQVVFTQGLIVANNYNWETITTEATIATTGHPEAIEVSANWNTIGLLNQASLSSDGVVAVSINLVTAGGEIPGYEIATLLVVFPLTVIGIIYYIRKRDK